MRSYRHFTDMEIEYIKTMYPYQDIQKTADYLCRSVGSIQFMVKKLGLTKAVRKTHQRKKGFYTKRDYTDPEYKKFRLTVRARDGKKCQWPNCNETRRLHVHHIRPYATNYNERFNPDNGITLCYKHHYLTTRHEEKFLSLFLQIVHRNKQRNQNVDITEEVKRKYDAADIIGQKMGILTVLTHIKSGIYACRCDCGKTVKKAKHQLKKYKCSSRQNYKFCGSDCGLKPVNKKRSNENVQDQN